MNNKSVLKKYETIVSNIEWHIKTNEPPEEEIEKLNAQLDIYREVIHDFSYELHNLPKSTENLSKIADKDEWLNEVRGNEPIEETAEKYATELGYPQSDKTQFTCTFWTHHNIAAQGFIDGVNFKNKINKEPVGEDGLLKKFKALRLQIFTKMDSIPTVLSDYPTEKTANDLTQIAKQYSDSKLSELEKWIDNSIRNFEYFPLTESEITIMNNKEIEELQNKITRVEVIDEKGRSYVNWNDTNKIELSFQDNGRTLKIFIEKKKS